MREALEQPKTALEGRSTCHLVKGTVSGTVLHNFSSDQAIDNLLLPQLPSCTADAEIKVLSVENPELTNVI